MILQALNEYYQRKTRLPNSDLAPLGFEHKAIPFLVVLSAQGEFVTFDKMYEGEGKKRTDKFYLVPQGVKRSSGVAANLLWDNPGYVFGIDSKGKPERAREQHLAFIEAIRSRFAQTGDAGIRAVLAFLERGDFAKVFEHPLWMEILESSANLTFRLEGEACPVCERETVAAVLSSENSNESGENALCLVSGEIDVIERLHPSVKGVWGAQSSGASMVSFNLDAFSSYGKEQGENAPVGKRAVFAYTTALNYLLAKGSQQRIQVGDASTVFWAEKPEHPAETLFRAWDNPDADTGTVKALLAAPNSGVGFFEDEGTRFYLLGLAPNAARIAVRFWHVKTVGELAVNIRRHFDDLRIDHAPHEPETLSLSAILRAISRKKNDGSYDFPPNLGGDVMRSVIENLPYPQTLLSGAIRRIRAEQEVTCPRAAIIKACINRNEEREELKVSLDENSKNIAYRLGRLFMVLERVQEEANPGIRATIRNTFWGAASGTPGKVFPMLINLSNKHLAKIRREKPGRATNLEKLIGSIMEAFDPDAPFPTNLLLNEQGCFSVGYYHQKQHPSTYKAQGE